MIRRIVNLAIVAGMFVGGCHETPSAAVAQAIDLTNAVCSAATDVPATAPYVEIVCSIAQAGEQLVSVVVGSLGSDAMPVTASVPVTEIRIRLAKADAPAFLAAHKGK